jgi:PAS domain S-box-containing protein
MSLNRRAEREDAALNGNSSELYHQLVASVTDYAIFALDAAGHILSWNPGAERINGYTADEIIGRHFSIFYPPVDVIAGKPAGELEVAARDGRVEDEGWRIRKDGSRFWANVVVTALRNADGRLIGFAKVTRDLTEQRGAEDALRQSEERLRLLVQSVKDYAIFMLDADGRVASWNEGAQRIKGYAAEEILGQSFTRFYPQEALDARFPQYELEVAARDGRFEDEGWRVRKDGSRFWANVVITALRNADGRLIGFAKVTRDLTTRLQAEEQARRLAAEEAAHAEAARRSAELARLNEQLATQEARFRTLANAIPQLAWTTDPSGARHWFNERWYEYTGTTLEEVRGWGWQKVHHPDHMQRVVAGIRRSLELGEPWEDTFPLRGADGQYRWFLSRALPIRDDEGGIVGWLGTNTDITEQKRAEEERARLYEAEHAARAEAEAAVRARDTFVAALSHDLLNPLAAIRGQVQLLQRRVSRGRRLSADDLTARLANVEDVTTRMVDLINELLDATRLEAGQPLPLHRQPTDLVALAREAVQKYQHTAETNRVRFETTDDSLVSAWDAGRLERVLANLLSNAIKYSPAGGDITVTVSRDGDWGVLTVEDRGIGIPAQDLPHIFERYRRASNVTDSVPGTGLGLANARDIVDQHGGSIAVRSQEGVGSTFTVRLPMAGEENPSPAEPR